MTRFNITMEEGARFVLFALEQMWGGEIFVPKIPSYKITDLATAVGSDCRQEIVGIRPGEKLHEEMITATDSLATLEFKDYYTIIPERKKWSTEDYIKTFGGERCQAGFQYASDKNDVWLSVEELRQLIEDNVINEHTNV